ncbi:putative armadillo-like helical protein [Helianthus annuus]|nr:putative armadillo-like helical protein [Helianthus annuus]
MLEPFRGFLFVKIQMKMRLAFWLESQILYQYVSKYEGDLLEKYYFAEHKLEWEVIDGGLKNKIEIAYPISLSRLGQERNKFNALEGLGGSHGNIRAKAAEDVSTIFQNNLKSQQLVMDANGTKPLLSNFTYDDDVTVRTKALGAIFSE